MASNGTYAHRALPPGQPSLRSATQIGSRVHDAFETIKQEFELLQADRDALRTQRDDLEVQVNSQVNEVNAIRHSLYDLEVQQGKARQHYEEELRRLRSEVVALRQNGPSSVPPGIPGFQPLPSINAGGPPPPLPLSRHGPPPSIPDFFTRGGDRVGGDPESSAKDMKTRGGGGAGAGGPISPTSENGWGDSRQHKTRDSRDLDRIPDIREPKRPKPDLAPPEPSPIRDRDLDGPETLPPPPPPPPPQSLHSAAAAGAHPPSGSANSNSNSNANANVVVGPLRSHVRDPSDYQLTLPPINTNPQPNFNNTNNEDLALNNVPPEYRKEGSDWFAVFNPRVKRSLDITLMHSFTHASVVCCVQFSLDGKLLATGCNRTAQIYDVNTGSKICVLADDNAEKTGDLYIRSVRFSPDRKLLATGAEDRRIRLWDISKKKIRKVFDGHQQEIYSLDFSRDGQFIVSGSGDKTARIWDTFDGSSKVLTINDQDSHNNDAGVTSVAISPNGQLVAAGSLDTVVRIWDVASGVLLERLKGHRDSVYSVAFTPDGKGLVSGSLDKSLKYWDVSALMSAAAVKARKEAVNEASSSSSKKAGEKLGVMSPCIMDFVGHKDYVLSVSVSHDGHWVVSGSKDRCVHFWDSRNAAMQFMLQGHKNSVISLDVNPTGNMLATGSGDSLARIWRYTSIS